MSKTLCGAPTFPLRASRSLAASQGCLFYDCAWLRRCTWTCSCIEISRWGVAS
ncbi:hypothetical protein HBI56_069680 [Parastagonospora nodorum]|uniref:Uncharacterized protein n=1 Tax=Phaeosphaeria nodorum (strain SN15 / ATCC MYA-4574 / FGSC 10173) TaxID=321614 RepID=A0A7U2ENY3_PHANO|nr:hypothetical protein HBH56_004120 [Parastagonospora nodorum]QRC90321.1 hypothetical protein JI435_400360 [Parastagonospora nodorum SN15]KAH3937876.1 hypothetical protein HBH54_004110 [Parastagonospora nodorum]KAH3946491.1 hypothetical protein HBH53_127860 [Parastagonospora nodorum]KAH3974999.1 hypothetical protein HBH51_086870 [Parastagonospora nodorum]